MYLPADARPDARLAALAVDLPEGEDVEGLQRAADLRKVAYAVESSTLPLARQPVDEHRQPRADDEADDAADDDDGAR